MANNYMQFSEAIGKITDEEAAWITEKLNQTDVFWHTPETFFEDKKNQLTGLKQEINTL